MCAICSSEPSLHLWAWVLKQHHPLQQLCTTDWIYCCSLGIPRYAKCSQTHDLINAKEMKEILEISLAHHMVNHLTSSKLEDSRKAVLQFRKKWRNKNFPKRIFLGRSLVPSKWLWNRNFLDKMPPLREQRKILPWAQFENWGRVVITLSWVAGVLLPSKLAPMLEEHQGYSVVLS